MLVGSQHPEQVMAEQPLPSLLVEPLLLAPASPKPPDELPLLLPAGPPLVLPELDPTPLPPELDPTPPPLEPDASPPPPERCAVLASGTGGDVPDVVDWPPHPASDMARSNAQTPGPHLRPTTRY
jgi:hypothetical protein